MKFRISLLKSFYKAEEEWEIKACDRLIGTEPPSGGPHLQDGNGGGYIKGHLGRSLGMFCGYRGRLFPRSHELGLPQISRLQSPWQNLRLPIPPIRAFTCPVGFLQGDKAHKASPSHASDLNLQFPGRFHHLRHISFQSQDDNGDSAGCSPAPRLQDKLGEVLSRTFPVGRVSRSDLGSSEISPLSSGGQEGVNKFKMPGDVPQDLGNEKRTGEPDGGFELRSYLHTAGSSASSSHTSLDESTHFSRAQRYPGPYRRGSPEVTDALDGSGFPKQSCSIAGPSSVPYSDDRCLPGRVVRCSPPSEDTGYLEGQCKLPFDELEGVKGCSPLSVGVSVSSKGQGCSGAVRQHHGYSLPETPGFSKTPPSSLSHFRNSSVLQGLEDKPSSSSSEGGTECTGGPGVSSFADCNGVVPGQDDLLLPGVPGPSFPCGLVRHKGKHSTTSLCVTLPRSSGGGLRRIQLRLGSLDIHLPDAPPQLSVRRGSAAPELSRKRSAGRPLLAIEGVVPSPSHSLPRCASSSPCESVPLPDDVEGSGDPPVQPLLEPSRMASMMKPMVEAGLSDQSVEVYRRAHRPSTQKQYQMSWGKFLRFLEVEKIPHSAITENVVINYLSHLLLSEDKAYRTIVNYKCALQTPLKLLFNVDLQRSAAVEFFLKGVFASAPPESAPMASWGLDHLLSYLASDVFEPLHAKSLLVITRKALCLVLLATGRRIDEVQHLSQLLSWDESGELVTLHWVNKYVPKHYTKDFQPRLPVMERLSSDDMDELKLCPVRALQTYLAKYNCSPRLLDKSPLWSQSTTELTQMFISTAVLARRCAGDMSDVPVGPHQMRKFAASYSAKMVHSSGLDMKILMDRMGCCSMSVLNRTYIHKVPCLSFKAVVPVGTFHPALHIGT